MTRFEKRTQVGRDEGTILTLFLVAMTCFFGWMMFQTAGTLLMLIIGAVFLYIFGGLLMDFPVSGVSRYLKELFRICDTRNRVHAMEDYHAIDYTIIPEKRLYVKKGETCELVIKRMRGKVAA